MHGNDTEAGHEISAEDIQPQIHYPAAADMDADDRADHLEESAGIGDALDAIETLYANGIEDKERLVTYGRRMTTLIYHGGLAPSEAKARAALDLFRRGRRMEDVADLLGMSRGGLSRLKSKASKRYCNARRLHYMAVSEPMNVVFEISLAAEPPADYEIRYILLELLNPRTEPEEEPGVRPNPRVHPPEPQYCLVKEIHAPGESGIDLSADPDERQYGSFQGVETAWFADDEEVTEYLYESEYFETEERAELWCELLEMYEFAPEAEPRERINPDALMD